LRKVVYNFRDYFQALRDKTSETRITIILSPESTVSDKAEINHCNVIVFGELLPPPPQAPITVAIYRGARNNPEVKDTQWANDRKALADKKLPDEDEVILQSPSEGHLYEGLSSNFGVIMDGVLCTPPKGAVLEGATLELILSCCATNNIPVVRKFPNIEECHLWEGAFISSTTRCLLPINYIRKINTNTKIEIPVSPKLVTLSKLFLDVMQNMSVDVSTPSMNG